MSSFLSLSDLQRGLIVWGSFLAAAFLPLELAAHFKLIPVPTFSGTVWDGIKSWPPVAYLVALLLFELLGHFDMHWSVRWLIGAGLFSTAVVLAHLATR
jgi:hypothetical protein